MQRKGRRGVERRRRHGCHPHPLGPPRALGVDRRLRVRPVPLRRPGGELGATYRQAGEKRAEVAALKERQRRAASAAAELRDKRALEREARRLGMVKAGEKAYVVELPPR